MPVGRNFCYKKSVSADRKFYLLVRFFIHNREKIQVITSDCAVCLNVSVKDVDDTADMRGEREHPVFFKTGCKGQTMRFYLLQKPGSRYEGITVFEIIL